MSEARPQGSGGSHDGGATQPPPRVDYDTVFTNAKAGMEGVDPEHVKRVVFEASKGTPHYENEQRKSAATDAKIAKMRVQLAGMGAGELAAHAAAMDAKLAELEASRDLSRTWLHVDMDAFFAAVEELDQPQLRSRPFAVGGLGMISTANYVARKYGVRSAMPGFIALKLCPQLAFVKPDFSKYLAASEATRAVFRRYDPGLQTASLDEAALDVTDYCAAHGATGEQVAAEIRAAVERETRLTCSVGIAPNRMLAKICSDKQKPNGQFALASSREAVMAFMRDLPIRKVPGVGKVTQRTLAAFGVHTAGDLLEQRGVVEALFSAISSHFFAQVALGLGETRHAAPLGEGEVGRKGISTERTFRALSRRADLEAKLRECAGMLAADMAAEGLRGRTLTLKLKLTSFELRTRATTLGAAVCTADELFAAGLRLLRAEMPCELRLLGLRVSNFVEAGKREKGQRSLEDMLLKGRQQQQQGEQQEAASPPQQGQQQQQQQEANASAAAGGCSSVLDDDAAGDGVHTSQVLSAGEMLELTLRDWGPPADDTAPRSGGGGGGDPAAAALARSPGDSGGADMVSLPPSLTVSPATAARFDREAAAGGSGGGGAVPVQAAPAELPPRPRTAMHMPATGLDLMLQQAADRLAQGGAGEQPPAPPQQQQQQQQQQAPSQQQQQTWACSACTFANPRSAFWCDVCGTSRVPRRESSTPAAGAARAAAVAPSAKPPSTGSGSKAFGGFGGGSGGKASGSSGGKGKRGQRAGAGPPVGPSILRFVSSQQKQQHSPPAQQEQQQQRQERQQQEQRPEQQQDAKLGQPASEQQPQQPQAPQAGEGEQPPQQQERQGQEESDEEWDFPPESPLEPGEDVFECRECGAWVRQTKLQAHEDEHMARRLQREEDKLDRMFGANAAANGGGKAGSKGGGGAKKAPGGGGGGGSAGKSAGKRPGAAGGAGGRQATLVAFKRPRQ